jgi:hypothetical protein
MSNQQLLESIQKVTSISDPAIMNLAADYDMPHVGEILIARKDDLAKKAEQLGMQLSAAEHAGPAPTPMAGSEWLQELFEPETKLPTSSKSIEQLVQTIEMPAAPAFDPTSKEAKLAMKTTALPSHKFASPEAKAAIAEFNQQYAGKQLTQPAELQQKIAAYGAMMTQVQQHEAAYGAKMETAQAQLKVEQEQANKAYQAELAKSYGQGDPKAVEHLELLKKLGTPSYFLSDAQSQIEQHGFDMAATQLALIKAYTGHYFGQVNTELRQGSVSADQYKFAKGLNEALDRLPPTGPMTVYRKVSSLDQAEVSKYKPGYIVHQRAFTSCSTDPKKWSGDWRYVIKGYSGRDIAAVSEHPSEKEVLFKHNTPFHVTKVEGQVIHMEEVD